MWVGWRRVASERLDHHQEHDPDHQNRRYLVDNPIELSGALVLIHREFAHAAHEEAVHGGQHQHQ